MKYLSQLRSLIILVMVSALMLSTSLPMVSAQFINPGTDKPKNLDDASPYNNFRDVALIIIDFFLSFLGFIAVVAVMYGGVLYVTAAGHQDKVDTAKKIVTYAALGLIVILLSYAFVNTILAAGTGQEPLN